MKTTLLLLLFLQATFSTDLHSQTVSPGAVKSPLHWYISDPTSSAFTDLTQTGSRLPLLLPGKNDGILNFRPALSLSGQSSLSLLLRDSSLSSATYFTVYQSKNLSAENIIWHRTTRQKTGLVLTTSRLADLTDNQYMNYTDRKPLAPKVNTYIQQQPKDSFPVTPQQLILGRLPASPSLPIVAFTGLLPEILIYNRVLTTQEQLKVSSYLCLKYGVTLSEPEGTYLNSSNETIWDGNKYSDFHHNIAGLVRDDSSGLLQKKATSENNPGLLVVSTTENMDNNSFLLWGDNDLPLTLANKIAGVPTKLNRTGQFVLHRTGHLLPIDISFDTKQIDAPRTNEPVYWLALDSSGHHGFTVPATTYIKMTNIDARGIAFFNNIIVRNPITHYGVVVGSQVLLTSEIAAPTCSDPQSGIIKVKVWGATYPCDIKLTSSTGQVIFEQRSWQNQTITIPAIAAGRYAISATDALQHRHTDTYYVNNSDGPVSPTLQDNYYLLPGQQLELDAGNGQASDVSYHWRGPGITNPTSAKITITKEGLYTLTSIRNGCSYVKEITIAGAPQNLFTNLTVFPNPSNTGTFNVRLTLDKIAPVTMSIFAEDGRFIGMKEMKGFANYNSSYQLTENGLYFLVFRSGLSVITKELIVIKD